MKQKTLTIMSRIIYLALVFSLFAVFPQEIMGYTLSLETTSNGATQKTSFARGDSLYLNVVPSDFTDIAGAALTINYPPDVLELDPATIEATGLSTAIESPFFGAFTAAAQTEIMRRGGSLEAGKLLLSGAMIDAATGGAKTNTGGILFSIKFRVKSDATLGTAQLALTQTSLNNTAAGYPAAGENVPALVGAVPNTDSNWNNLSGGAFPILLASLAAPVTKTFEVIIPPTFTISGTVAYTGYQSGDLKVAAFGISDSNFNTPIGGQKIAWPQCTTSKNFALAVPNGSYYLAAYIDVNANGNRENWEPGGQYTSSTVSIAGGNDNTTRAFALTDPAGTAGEPLYYINWKTTNGWANIGSMNNDFDHDGYSNIQEYLNRKSDPTHWNPSDATNKDAQNGPGYDRSTDDRYKSIAPWQPINGQQYNMVAYGHAYDGQSDAVTGDWIGAFGPGGIGDCRAAVQVTAGGNYYFTIVGNTNGERITYKLKRAADGQTVDASENSTFTSDLTEADKALHFSDMRPLSMTFTAGWNWVSFNVLPKDTSIAAFFGANASLVQQVKTQTDSVTNTGEAWMGNLSLMSKIGDGVMFKVKVSQGFTLEVAGMPITPTLPIALNNGWTWVACLPNRTMSVENALAGIMSSLVQVKSQSQSRTKVGTALNGDLLDMMPGKGYAIKANAVGTLAYP